MTILNRALSAIGLMRVGEHERLARDLKAEAARNIEPLTVEIAKLADERDEALADPWPKWAADLLAIIREYTGPCPEDGWEGVDLPEEMRVWLEGYRDEMQRAGNVKPIPQTEWEALQADALLWRNARDKRAKKRGGGK